MGALLQRLAILMLVPASALPVVAAKRVTVEQLQHVLAADRGRPDTKVAQQLAGLELTERLNAADFTLWERNLPGPLSRQSLVLLADQSAFLPPPVTEIPVVPVPDVAAQRQMVALAAAYAARAMHQLPNFIATRNTIRFEDNPPAQRPDSTYTPYKPLHAVRMYSSAVVYRDGKEQDSSEIKGKKSDTPIEGLITSGEFGPIIAMVLTDAAAQRSLIWSHWEQGTAGKIAAFQFVVPRDKSHYQIEYCCAPGERVDGVVARSTGYHGEMAINPTTGAIGRLAIGADLKHAAGILRADMLVEYGPVEIGGQTYVCPVKSVSISVAPLQSSEGSDRSPVPVMLQGLQANQEIAPRTMLNDVVFDEYHVFRSEARMVSGEGETSAASATAGSVAGTDRANQSPEANSQAEIARAESSTSPAAAEGNGANSSANSGAVASPAAAVSAESLSPEISEADAFGIPDAPAATAAAPDAQDKGFTLRLTSRLVDVGVAALDKKGHPVTGLKPQEFEIYDNGRKQTVRFFSRTGSEASAEQGGVSAAGIYSNRRADVADAKPGNETTESSATVLLIDAGSLTAKDLTYARGQVLKFLDKVPASQRIGLYVQNWRGFQVLTEPVSDRALLETKLQNWMPDASDVAQAQEMEERNRQQFDTVLHSDDLKSVNGNVNSGPDTASTVDPQLRDFGANPARDGLLILTGVARHLAATPGHKNLVWVASENVLVNWSGNAVSSDKGSKHLDAVALAAQEALNEAHVSIYPLDASQLETMAVDPSLKNRNIELDPSAVNGPQPQSGGGASGRIEAEMQQDTHTVQPLIQQMAQATGGRVFFRGGSIERDLDSVVDDGRAAYLLGFTPDVPADGQYHALSVKLTTHRNVTLRYRMGYEYDKEPTTLKDRFRQAIWQPLDLNEIGISVRPRPAYTGAALKLSISAGDVALRQQGGRWMDRLDIFVVHRELDGAHARITGRTLQLSLRLATYQSLMESGIPFEQFVQKSDDTASLRIIVVDENSGRMGSITLPAEVLNTAP